MYNDQEQMIDDQILSKFLDNAVAKAKKRIEEEGRIETEDAIPLMLKSQFNHIAHLEQQMITRTEFNARFNDLESKFIGLKDQFAGLKDQFAFVKWVIMLGFALLASLQIYVAFIQ